ncbi:CBS domain-containing protein [Micromonospora sp. NPDC048909]|uniref:CBS domain-containing protein n=1 Tax=Micromonospora sp. NPDC048909 TaxID=3155643 RepID=UPI0033D3B4BA
MRTWQVGDVMTRDVVTAREGTPYREIVDVLIRRGISGLPVTDGFRRVLGVVSEADLLHKIEHSGEPAQRRIFEGRRRRGARGDLLRVHLRTDAEIREDVVREVLHRILAVRDGLVTVQVLAGEVTLAGRLDRRSVAGLAGRLAARVSGVVRVSNTIAFDVDDTALVEEGRITPVA